MHSWVLQDSGVLSDTSKVCSLPRAGPRDAQRLSSSPKGHAITSLLLLWMQAAHA